MSAQLIRREKPAYLVFFDVDTFIKGATGTAFGREIFRRGIIGWMDLLRVLSWTMLYAMGRKSEVEMWKYSTAQLTGASDELMRNLSHDAYQRLLHERVFADAIDALKHHESKGGAPVLVSAGPRYVVEALAKALGSIPSVTAWPNVVDGIVTNLDGVTIPLGHGKREAAERLCAHHGVDPKDCWAYGDSVGDLEMLKFVGNPVAVNPRRKLRVAARASNWPTVRWSRTAALPIATAPGLAFPGQ